VVQGGGAFVEHASFVDYAIGRRTRFRKNLLDQGLTPAGEPISAETLAAPADLAQRMGLEDGALVHRFLARGLADDVPISLSLSFGRFNRSSQHLRSYPVRAAGREPLPVFATPTFSGGARSALGQRR
jgi:DNA-binding GntR family transcriptional regulator